VWENPEFVEALVMTPVALACAAVFLGLPAVVNPFYEKLLGIPIPLAVSRVLGLVALACAVYFGARLASESF
jgi:hypothetical protein